LRARTGTACGPSGSVPQPLPRTSSEPRRLSVCALRTTARYGMPVQLSDHVTGDAIEGRGSAELKREVRGSRTTVWRGREHAAKEIQNRRPGRRRAEWQSPRGDDAPQHRRRHPLPGVSRRAPCRASATSPNSSPILSTRIMTRSRSVSSPAFSSSHVRMRPTRSHVPPCGSLVRPCRWSAAGRAGFACA
jgi:hypothetical protein